MKTPYLRHENTTDRDNIYDMGIPSWCEAAPSAREKRRDAKSAKRNPSPERAVNEIVTEKVKDCKVSAYI
jgi:hypothetical protein